MSTTHRLCLCRPKWWVSHQLQLMKENKYVKYYYNEHSVDTLLNLILSDKKAHMNDKNGFWCHAHLIEKHRKNR